MQSQPPPVFDTLRSIGDNGCRCEQCRRVNTESDAEFGRWLRKTLRAAGIATGMALASLPNAQTQGVAQGVADVVTRRTKDSDERTRARPGRNRGGASPPDREDPPSAVRSTFERAAQAGDWRNAFLNLNGLNMFEMLRSLEALTPDVRQALWDNRGPFTGMIDMPRIAYARSVVLQRMLPNPIGDLQETGQIADAAQFIAEKLLPVARQANRRALPHLSLILQACRQHGITDKSQVAYVLASAHHESGVGSKMIEGASGAAYEGRRNLGNTTPGDGPRYKGRGYVQITGRRNYTRYGALLGVDLVGRPERAAEPAIAAQILAHGMAHGTFTSRRLADFGTDGSYDFVNARRIVNKLDRAESIAAIARRYRAALG